MPDLLAFAGLMNGQGIEKAAPNRRSRNWEPRFFAIEPVRCPREPFASEDVAAYAASEHFGACVSFLCRYLTNSVNL